MLSFFDQYAYSHSPWSPDGKSLVVAGSKGEVARRSNGLTPTGDRIYVLDAEGDAAPRDLGAGVLAFWSWS
jgi:Tol biopolymer transport system component